MKASWWVVELRSDNRVRRKKKEEKEKVMVEGIYQLKKKKK